MNAQAPRRFRDDPRRDYRARYQLPDQFIWEEASWPRIDFEGYTRMALELLPEVPGRVLDVGCGPGAVSSLMIDRGYEVVGVDYSERAIAFARTLVPDASFHVADVRDLGALEPGSSFGAATCIEVLEHVPPSDRINVFEGVAHLLSPGGVFVITSPTSAMSANRWDYERPSLSELTRLLGDTGFRVDAIRFQHRLLTAFDPRSWRVISNRFVDLPPARRVIRWVFLSRWNEVGEQRRAGRLVLRARRV